MDFIARIASRYGISALSVLLASARAALNREGITAAVPGRFTEIVIQNAAAETRSGGQIRVDFTRVHSALASLREEK